MTFWSMAQVTTFTFLSHRTGEISCLYTTIHAEQAVSPSQFFRKISTFVLTDVKMLNHHLFIYFFFTKKKKKDAHSYCEVIRKILLQVNYRKIKYTSKVCGLFVYNIL